MLFVAVLTLLVAAGCDHWPVPPSSISVESGPTFLLRGKGKLAAFTISGPSGHSRIANADFDRSDIIWEIQCPGSIFSGAAIEGLRLQYGAVPRGCHQIVPTPPEIAASLVAQRIYFFRATSNLAGSLGGNFYMRSDGASVPIDIDNCFMIIDGQWARVNCQSRDRFKEPTDIEAFARAHQRKCAFRSSEVGPSDLCE